MKGTRAAIRPLEQRTEPDPSPPTSIDGELRPAAHVRWLIENYQAPSQLLGTSADDRDTALEAVAAVYRSRPRRETFIEWLWRHYPPRARPDV